MTEILFLSRAAWGALPLPRLGHVIARSSFASIVSHHTVMRAPVAGDVPAISSYMRGLQTARADLGLDVPYSFVVFAGSSPSACVICEGRGWTRTGAHTAGLNSSTYGVAYGADMRVDALTDGMLEGVRWIGRRIQAANVGATTGHRDHKATECPGDPAYTALPLLQPPFVSTAPPATEEGSDMVLVDDREARENWLTWEHDDKQFCRLYGRYRGQGTNMPGASTVIREQIAAGRMIDAT